jgi:hypothetical protein
MKFLTWPESPTWRLTEASLLRNITQGLVPNQEGGGCSHEHATEVSGSILVGHFLTTQAFLPSHEILHFVELVS